MTSNEIQQTLRVARRALRISPILMWKKLGISHTTLYRWENLQMKPDLDTLVKWAHELGYTLDIKLIDKDA